MNGPFVIACRGHSGGRILSEAFIRNRIDMGKVNKLTKDTEFFSPFRNPLLQEVVLNAYDYPHVDMSKQRYFQLLMKNCIKQYIEKEITEPDKPFGWKFGESIFTLQVLFDTFPSAKIIHLIRDGRDVMLSRLDARFGRLLSESFNKVIVFGDKHADRFLGHPLNKKTVKKFRNELEMMHWVTSVNFGLRGRAYQGCYLEIKYEEMCLEPVKTFQTIFDFLDVPFHENVREWLLKTVHPNRVGKWRSLPPAQIEQALYIGEPLLKELGYL